MSTVGKNARRRELRSIRSEEHTSELQSPCNLVCRLLLEKKKNHSPARTRAPSRYLSGSPASMAPFRGASGSAPTQVGSARSDIRTLTEPPTGLKHAATL